MPAYIIADVEVLDPIRYADYRTLSTAAFGAHGVEPIVRGGRTTPLEGRMPGRTVVLKFESVEAAQAFYDSPEYLKAREAREGIAVMNMFIVEGA